MSFNNDTMGVLEWSELYEPFIVIIVMIFMIMLMAFLYLKIRIWVLMMAVFTCSLIFGVMAFEFEFLPFQPYIPVFFIIFQSVFFLLISMEAIKG